MLHRDSPLHSVEQASGATHATKPSVQPVPIGTLGALSQVVKTSSRAQHPSIIILAILLLSFSLHAQEWTRFRGPNGTGISVATNIPTHLTPSNILWKTALAGVGHSSPVIWGDHAFLTVSGETDGGVSVLCIRTTDGSIEWRKDFPLNPFTKHKFNSFASATPAVTGDALFTVWNDPDHYWLTAFSHSGNQLWQRDLGAFVSQHACGTSPIVVDGMVILGGEQDGQESVPGSTRSGESFIIAVDAKSGKTIWRTPRNNKVVAYSTPCVVESANGKRLLIFNSQAHGIYAVRPQDGSIAWEYNTAFDKRSVSSPLVAGDLVFGSCGSGGGGNYLVAIKMGDAASGKSAERAYDMKKAAPYVPTGIVRGNLGWFWSDGGMLTCLHTPTGDIRYQERVGGNYFGSPVWADDRLFCVSTSGELTIVQASETFKVLHRFELGELCHSTPAISGNRMYIHTEHHLICLGAR